MPGRTDTPEQRLCNGSGPAIHLRTRLLFAHTNWRGKHLALCRRCNTPLVRARDGRRSCVGCDMDVVQAGGGGSAGDPAFCKPIAFGHHGFTMLLVGQTRLMEPVFAWAGPGGAVAGGVSAAAPSQPHTAAGPAIAFAARAAAAANNAGHSASRLQMYEAAGRRDGRGPGAGDSQGTPSPATPESPAFPAPVAAAGAASQVSPQGGRPTAALPAGWLSRTHQQPAAIGVPGAESPTQLPQLPPWMAPAQRLVSVYLGCSLSRPASSQRSSHPSLLAQIPMK